MKTKFYRERVTLGRNALLTLSLLCVTLLSAKVTVYSSSDTYAMTPSTENETEHSTESSIEKITDCSTELGLTAGVTNALSLEHLNTVPYQAKIPMVYSTPKQVNSILIEVVDTTLYYNFHGVDIDVDTLMSYYDTSNEDGTLSKKKDYTVQTLSNFLVTQMNVSPEIAAGILGNVYAEGTFGQQQRSYELASNIDEYVAWLNKSDGLGYGIAQWTYYSLQDGLIDRLYEVRDWFIEAGFDEKEVAEGSLFSTVVILAECTYLYDELLEKNIFTDFNEEYTIEDATGHMAAEYERYENSSKQWKKKNGTYTLISGEGTSSYERLQYALAIYEYLLTLV